MLGFVRAIGAIAKAIPELKMVCERLIVLVKQFRANHRKNEKNAVIDSRIDAVLERVRHAERKR